MLRSIDIHVDGTVQGVGFRPFVYRIAKKNLVSGWVLNSSSGVDIHIEGEVELVVSFLDDLENDAPQASHIDSICVTDVPAQGYCGFEIRMSEDPGDAGAIGGVDGSNARDGSGVDARTGSDAHVASGSRSASGPDGPDSDASSSLGATARPSASRPRSTHVPADMATCSKCLSEMRDRSNRRYRYPFINCTECGPRFTIISGLPYDRPRTSMASFEMCPECAAEYQDPLDRRFHAQPDACFECGPSISAYFPDDPNSRPEMSAPGGRPIVPAAAESAIDDARHASDAVIAAAAEMLLAGGIVAEKGLGGYHLSCDARSEEAVARLRKRKRRDGKPLAIMVENIEQARSICMVDSVEQALLESPQRPIVLLRTNPRPAIEIAPSVAPGLSEIGIMLPCTPLQYLLMEQVGIPLVMTSGNISESPIIGENGKAHRSLGDVSDMFIDNDRDIISRYDDSVARVVSGKVQMVRRARGYAPLPVPFPTGLGGSAAGQPPSVLAAGPEQKSTFCITSGNEAFVSQHIGDLESVEAIGNWRDALELYMRLFSLSPQAVACDMHPEYLSTKWSREATGSGGILEGMRLVEVQHHHAHIASVIGENVAAGSIDPDARVLGIALDGTGYGTDKTIWGGELLVCDAAGFDRAAHLATIPMPGGRGAIDHPCRMAWSLLRTYGEQDRPGAQAVRDAVGETGIAMLDSMLASDAGCVATSSCGRLLDAFSALLGICPDASFDGQAPMLLEGACLDISTGKIVSDPDPEKAAARYEMEIRAEAGTGIAGSSMRTAGSAQSASPNPGASATASAAPGEGAPDPCMPIPGPLTIDPGPTLRAALDDIEQGVATGLVSLRIHMALCRAFARACRRARDATGISTAALSGGVMANRIVATTLPDLLRAEGFKVLEHISLPPNDGCISYGQAVVASATLGKR